jgi:hypothetical protein
MTERSWAFAALRTLCQVAKLVGGVCMAEAQTVSIQGPLVSEAGRTEYYLAYPWVSTFIRFVCRLERALHAP